MPLGETRLAAGQGTGWWGKVHDVGEEGGDGGVGAGGMGFVEQTQRLQQGGGQRELNVVRQAKQSQKK